MEKKSTEALVDELYQRPLEEFTAARNELAKKLGGAAGARIRRLPKPPLPSWAVNQLYWRKRSVFERVIEASKRLFKEHAAAAKGRQSRLREASAAYRASVNKALHESLKLIEAGGHEASAAKRAAVIHTLEALREEVRPGRIAKPPSQAGFEVLAGLGPAQKRPRVDRKEAFAKIQVQSSPSRRALEQEARAAKREAAAQTSRKVSEAAARLRSAQRKTRAADDALTKAAARVASDRKSEGLARAKHESTLKKLAQHEAELDDLRRQDELARALLKEAEEDLALLRERGKL